MENLVEIKNNQVVVSSRQVAKKFGKLHKDVLESIREIIKAENSALTFYQENTYKAGTGRSYPEYLMNRDGFALLAMGFTGEKAVKWKIAYINAFNKMEAELLKPRLKNTEAENLYIDPDNEEFKAILNDASEKISTLVNLIDAWRYTYRNINENEIYMKIVLEHSLRIYEKLAEVRKITFKTGTLEKLKCG